MLKSLQEAGARWGQGPREAQALALLRVTAGLFLLVQGYEKWTDPHFAGKLSGYIEAWTAGTHPFDLYKLFLQAVVLPNVGAFAALVTLGELFAGLSLLAGFLVQWSAPAVFFMCLNFFLAAQHTSPAAQGINLIFMALALALYWGKAGQHYGLDAWVFRADAPKAKMEASGKKKKPKKASATDLIDQKSRKKPRSKTKPF